MLQTRNLEFLCLEPARFFTHPASSLVRSIVRLVTLLRQNSQLQDIFCNIVTAKSSFEATTSGLSKLQFLSFWHWETLERTTKLKAKGRKTVTCHKTVANEDGGDSTGYKCPLFANIPPLPALLFGQGRTCYRSGHNAYTCSPPQKRGRQINVSSLR